MDDVVLEDATESLGGAAIEGPRTEEIVRSALGGSLPDAAAFAHCEANGLRILRSTLSGQPGLWILGPPDAIRGLADGLENAGAVGATEEEVRAVRIENRRPRFGEDYSSAHIPHETQQLQAVSFTKGCYLGQEIVERVRSRGQVQKLLVSVELEGREVPEAGTPITLAGREVGRLTSPVFSPRRNCVLGFSVVRREAAADGTAIAAGEFSGKVRAPSP
jgi:aminomethyltransferase